MKFYTAAQLIDETEQANKIQEEVYEEAKIRNMSLRTSLQEVGTTVQGLWEDLFHNTDPKSLKELFIVDNRCRGLGLILVGLSLSGLIVDAVL